jgi:hypothetical protein
MSGNVDPHTEELIRRMRAFLKSERIPKRTLRKASIAERDSFVNPPTAAAAWAQMELMKIVDYTEHQRRRNGWLGIFR